MSDDPTGLHVDLDGAWAAGALPSLRVLDVREWGPRLRFCALEAEMEAFYAAISVRLGDSRFLVYGSGDFHHLSALWLRRVPEPVTLVSFDNHPDWDIRPPKWCCGSWMNRALDLAGVRAYCGLGAAATSNVGAGIGSGAITATCAPGRLTVHPWADGRSAADQAHPGAITQESWRTQFERFAAGLAGGAVYVTVDIDGLRTEDAVTNWENGRFAAADLTWGRWTNSHGTRRLWGATWCGARSEATYARWTQRFASETDHPKLPAFDRVETTRVNARTFETIWPHLAR